MLNENTENNENTQNNQDYFYGTSQQNPSGDFYSPQNNNLKPKKKKGPIIACVVGGIAVIGAGVGCYAAFSGSPSFATPTEAVTSCVNQLGEQFSAKELNMSKMQEKLGSEDLLKDALEKGQYADMSLTLEGSDMDEIAMLSGVTVGFSYQNDVANGRNAFGINGSIMGFGGDIGLYMDEDMIALTSEEFLSDTYLSVTTDEIMTLLTEEMSQEEIDELFSVMESSSAITEGLYDYMEYAAEELPSSLESFLENCEIEENEQDELKIGKEEYECYSYDVSITANAFKGFLENYGSYLADYDYNSNPFFAYIAESSYEGEEIDFNELMKEGLETLPDSIDEDDDETIDFTMHISSEGKLLGMNMEAEDGTTMELLFGGKKPGQEIYCNIDAGPGMEANFSMVSSTKDDVENMTMTISADMYDENVKLEYSTDYNTEDDTFDMSVVLGGNIEGEVMDMTISANGEYKDIEKGKGYTIEYDEMKLELSAPSLELPFSEITLSGEVSYGVLEDGLTKPEGTEYSLLNLTEADVAELMEVLKESQTFSYILQAIPEDEIEQSINDALAELK